MTQTTWVGTAAELLGELESIAGKFRLDMNGFPKGAAQLGMVLENIARELETFGIVVRRDSERTGKNRDRFIRITKTARSKSDCCEPEILLLEG
jgi:hypothetical protein